MVFGVLFGASSEDVCVLQRGLSPGGRALYFRIPKFYSEGEQYRP